MMSNEKSITMMNSLRALNDIVMRQQNLRVKLYSFLYRQKKTARIMKG